MKADVVFTTRPHQSTHSLFSRNRIILSPRIKWKRAQNETNCHRNPCGIDDSHGHISDPGGLVDPPIQRALPVNGSVTRATGINVETGATTARMSCVKRSFFDTKREFVPVTVLIAVK